MASKNNPPSLFACRSLGEGSKASAGKEKAGSVAALPADQVTITLARY